MPISTTSNSFRLPMIEQTYSVFPNNGLNLHFAVCFPEARAWIRKYENVICGPKMRAFLDNCKFELFAAYNFPYANQAGLKATMDHVRLLTIIHLEDSSCILSSLISCGSTMSSRIPSPLKEPPRLSLLLSVPFRSQILTTAPGYAT